MGVAIERRIGEIRNSKMPTVYRVMEFVSFGHVEPTFSCSDDSQKHFYFHSVTRTQLDRESSGSMLSSEENEKVDIDELQDFYLFWSMLCLILISLVLMAFTWVKINRKRPGPANIDLNFTKLYSYEPFPYK